ncbi:hypothetical protein A2U01_0043415, partial [Trifolium medium]|nr:hypothetical protein [Trifolium medium]
MTTEKKYDEACRMTRDKQYARGMTEETSTTAVYWMKTGCNLIVLPVAGKTTVLKLQ